MPSQSGHDNATFERLAAKHTDYVARQLAVLERTDKRPDGSMMKTVARVDAAEHR
jgi:ABC-type uncharacterized transport system YnjBCD substrate-binding protein